VNSHHPPRLQHTTTETTTTTKQRALPGITFCVQRRSSNKRCQKLFVIARHLPSSNTRNTLSPGPRPRNAQVAPNRPPPRLTTQTTTNPRALPGITFCVHRRSSYKRCQKLFVIALAPQPSVAYHAQPTNPPRPLTTRCTDPPGAVSLSVASLTSAV